MITISEGMVTSFLILDSQFLDVIFREAEDHHTCYAWA